MKLVELRPSMFKDQDAYQEAVDFHNERAASDPSIKVVEIDE